MLGKKSNAGILNFSLAQQPKRFHFGNKRRLLSLTESTLLHHKVASSYFSQNCFSIFVIQIKANVNL